jgi:hypothetical protein
MIMSTEQERAQRARANMTNEERIVAALEQIADMQTKIYVEIKNLKFAVNRP